MDRVDYQSTIIQELLNLQEREELNLNPWYQRRSVWTSAQQSYLINTLFEKKPIPALYVRHTIDLELGKSLREVVDGQQRTRAILGYCRDDFTARHPNHKDKVKYSKLSKVEKETFLLTAVPVGYLLGATDEDVIDIFARINSVSKNLNSQEKRNAAFSGEFKQFCLKQATQRLQFWRNYNVFTSNDIARMNEVQFVSDLVVSLLDGLTRYSSPTLDKYYEKYDEEFQESLDIEVRLDEVFDTIVSLDPDAIKDTIFRRPPLLFSLAVVLDELELHDFNRISEGLFEMDSIFNSDTPVSERDKEDIDFYNASSSTTQGLAQREIRHDYIRSFIS